MMQDFNEVKGHFSSSIKQLCGRKKSIIMTHRSVKNDSLEHHHSYFNHTKCYFFYFELNTSISWKQRGWIHFRIVWEAKKIKIKNGLSFVLRFVLSFVFCKKGSVVDVSLTCVAVKHPGYQ